MLPFLRYLTMPNFLVLLFLIIMLSCRTEKDGASKETSSSVLVPASDTDDTDSVSPEMSPATKRFVSRLKELSWQPDQELISQYNLRKINGSYHAGAILTVIPGANGGELEKEGVLIGTTAENIWTVKVPVAAFRNISDWENVKYIKIDQPLSKR